MRNVLELTGIQKINSLLHTSSPKSRNIQQGWRRHFPAEGNSLVLQLALGLLPSLLTRYVPTGKLYSSLQLHIALSNRCLTDRVVLRVKSDSVIDTETKQSTRHSTNKLITSKLEQPSKTHIFLKYVSLGVYNIDHLSYSMSKFAVSAIWLLGKYRVWQK